MYNIKFIKEEDFEKNVLETLASYKKTSQSIELNDFNRNIIDPIKLIFDKYYYNKTTEEIINDEVARQNDKTHSNYIGYFHQYIFRYIKNCKVPEEVWDVIFSNGKHKVYVEMKNKHNTMNSSSSSETYSKMLEQIKKTPKDYCYLVEVIASNSQNKPWEITYKNKKMSNDHIRRVSIDKFYEEVTGEQDAFYQICMQLPITLTKLSANNMFEKNGNNNDLIAEIKSIDPVIILAFYKMAFSKYIGFDKLNNR